MSTRLVRVVARIFYIGLLATIATSQGAYAETIAILNSQAADPKVAAQFGRGLSDSIVNVTRKFKKFNVLERNQFSDIVKEIKFQTTSFVDDRTAVGVGQQIGAQLVGLSSFDVASSRKVYAGKSGSSEGFEMNLTVSVRFVDIKSGEVVFSRKVIASATSSEPSALTGATLSDFERKFERELTAEYPNAGYVIKVVSPTEVILDLGKINGVAVDDSYAIYIEGEEIVHPVTGKVMKGEKTVIAEGTIASVASDVSTLKLTGSPTAKIQVGTAKVESKPKKAGFFESLKDFGLKVY
jgi:hypothetical protein